jgi:formate/nitrite transporter FocA (FNT family)
VAAIAGRTEAFDPHIRAAFAEIGRKAVGPDAGTILLRGVFAGWLIALVVWLLPFAEAARVWVIVIRTYVVGVGQFSHNIAGSVEVFTAAATGEAEWGRVLGGYVLPTPVEHVIGGVTPVACLNHAQVVAEGGGKDL